MAGVGRSIWPLRFQPLLHGGLALPTALIIQTPGIVSEFMKEAVGQELLTCELRSPKLTPTDYLGHIHRKGGGLWNSVFLEGLKYRQNCYSSNKAQENEISGLG